MAQAITDLCSAHVYVFKFIIDCCDTEERIDT